MNEHDDLDLRRRFAEARDLDAASAPTFGSLRQTLPPERPRRLAWLLPAAAVAAAALVVAVVLTNRPQSDDAIAQAAALSSWTAPTDAWLEMSELEIPDSVPSLSPSSVPLPETTAAATETGELQ